MSIHVGLSDVANREPAIRGKSAHIVESIKGFSFQWLCKYGLGLLAPSRRALLPLFAAKP